MFSRKKKFFVLSIALLCVSCLIFTGCGRANNNNTQQTPSNNQTENVPNEGTDGINGNNMGNNTDNNAANNAENRAADNTTNTNETVDNTELHQRAEKIAKAVNEEIAQVNDSRVVISEHMAYVSVDIEKTADTAESAKLKEEVTEVVKKTDKDIETVYVMADANTFTRMKAIGEDIAAGHPISGFVDELENMFVRVTPSAK